MEGECPKDLTGGIEEVMEGNDSHNWEGRLGSRKGMRTLERQREGVLWLGGSLRARQCFPGCHTGKSSDDPQVLLEKQEEKKANKWEESRRASGRGEIPSMQTTAGRGGKLIQGQ